MRCPISLVVAMTALAVTGGIAHADEILEVRVELKLGTHGSWDDEFEAPKWELKINGRLEPSMFMFAIDIFPPEVDRALMVVELVDVEGAPVNLVQVRDGEERTVTEEWRLRLDENPDLYEEEWRGRHPPKDKRVLRLRVSVKGSEDVEPALSRPFVFEQKLSLADAATSQGGGTGSH